jgi:hypothetical protein
METEALTGSPTKRSGKPGKNKTLMQGYTVLNGSWTFLPGPTEQSERFAFLQVQHLEAVHKSVITPGTSLTCLVETI